MKPKIILSLALVLSGGLFGCSFTPKPILESKVVSFANVFKKVEHQVPELESIGMSTGIPSSGQVWHGVEYGTASFVLRNNIRYHPAGEFPRETAPVPYEDINVTITRYTSTEVEQKDLKNTFRLRQATFLPKETYQGAMLFRYKGTSRGVMSAICQSGHYIVEISAYNEPGSLWTMKMLDAVLASLHSTLSNAEFSATDWQTEAIASEGDLNGVITQLQNPATRFDAFIALLEFAGYPKGYKASDDLKVDEFHKKAIAAIHSCPGLDAVIATMIDRMKEPEERLSMLRALLWFSAPGLQMGGMTTSSGSQSLDELLIKANQVANKAFDVPTVETALVDSDWLLRITTVNHFGNRSAGINEWKPLLPQMEKLAADDDPSVRSAADRRLREFPGTAKFLAERETNETSAVVLLQLLRDHYVGDEFKNQFLARFLPLLTHPDENVRDEALLFIGFNSHRAPMWQIPFGAEVFDQVIVSTQAKSAKERAAAAYALTDIRQIDKDRSREAFLHLVNDVDQDVRWRIAWGLSDQLGREDVKRVIAVLLKDRSLSVRYETILAGGAQRFIPELEELSKGPDPRVAQSAAQKLNQLATERKD